MDAKTQGSQGGINGIYCGDNGRHETVRRVEVGHDPGVSGRGTEGLDGWTGAEVAARFEGYRNVIIGCLKRDCQETRASKNE